MALQARGADLVELGIPYSDPLADGPVIQAAASRALMPAPHQLGAGDVGWAQGRLTMPVVLFTYSNPLLNVGMEKFCADAAAAGPLAWWCRPAA